MKQGTNKLILFLAIISLVSLCFFPGCDKGTENPDVPYAYVNITINPNSTLYQELNIISGWTYLDYYDGVRDPSRGIIVYRLSMDEFMAYERTPPFRPNECCTNTGVCTSLIVEYPFVVDTCLQAEYLIIDGSPMEGVSTVPLVRYQAEYDGYNLYIHN